MGARVTGFLWVWGPRDPRRVLRGAVFAGGWVVWGPMAYVALVVLGVWAGRRRRGEERGGSRGRAVEEGVEDTKKGIQTSRKKGPQKAQDGNK